VKLTDPRVSTAQCPAGRKDALVFDEALKGFGLRVTPAGARTFIFQCRNGAKVRRTVLGASGELTTARAWKKALRGQVRDHRDPVAERRVAQAEASRRAADAMAAAAAATWA